MINNDQFNNALTLAERELYEAFLEELSDIHPDIALYGVGTYSHGWVWDRAASNTDKRTLFGRYVDSRLETDKTATVRWLESLGLDSFELLEDYGYDNDN